MLLDGKEIAADLQREVAVRASNCAARGITPCLAVVLVGEDPASQVYVRNKSRRCAEAGIRAIDHRLPVTTTGDELLALVRTLGADPSVHGILVQLPLPKQIDAEAVLAAIDPEKDVDGFHPLNVGRLQLGQPGFVPCTPLGCLKLLQKGGVQIAGKRALVVGRSNIVGKPVAALLLGAHATVTIAHSRTADLQAEVERAEIVIAAIGRPNAIPGAWIRQGAAVIDVGINRLPDGSLTGDVEFIVARERAGVITPVPGGVGPMTIACLLSNVVDSAERRLS